VLDWERSGPPRNMGEASCVIVNLPQLDKELPLQVRPAPPRDCSAGVRATAVAAGKHVRVS